MSAFDLVPVPASPGSDDASLVFDDISSSDGVPSPSEPSVHVSLPPRASSSSCDAAKGIASVGVAVNSPPAFFVGTPFAAGPASLFEYPFPAVSSRPPLSNTSSLSSVSSALPGPPSPSTRAKFHPRPLSRLSSNAARTQPARRHFSGGNVPPPIRVPPRLRTDSGSSIVSSLADDPTVTIKPSPSSASAVPHSAPILISESGPATRLTPQPNSSISSVGRSSPLIRLRNRSGSLGVLPIQLPPPAITSMRTIGQLNIPVDPVSPAMVVGAMASPGYGGLQGSMAAAGFAPALRMTLAAGPSSTSEARVALERRRASIPSLFMFGEGELGDERKGGDGTGEPARSTSGVLSAKDKVARDEESVE